MHMQSIVNTCYIERFACALLPWKWRPFWCTAFIVTVAKLLLCCDIIFIIVINPLIVNIPSCQSSQICQDLHWWWIWSATGFLALCTRRWKRMVCVSSLFQCPTQTICFQQCVQSWVKSTVIFQSPPLNHGYSCKRTPVSLQAVYPVDL